jgi:hypothetical protein
MIVDVGFTVVEPMRVLVLNDPGVIATEDAFVMFQLSVLVPAEATIEEEAVKEEMAGGAAPSVVPLAMDDEAEIFPTLSWAVT